MDAIVNRKNSYFFIINDCILGIPGHYPWYDAV